MIGPGEFMGKVQHGFPVFKAGDLIKDTDIIEFAKKSAVELVESDPKLLKPENFTLKKLIKQRFAEKIKLINVA